LSRRWSNSSTVASVSPQSAQGWDAKLVDQVGRPLEGDRVLPNAGLIDVPLPIGDVVLVLLRGI
jgi:hypothetical protein